MPLPGFCQHVVKVISPGKRLVHGDLIDDWAPGVATTREIPGCWVEAASTEENTHRRNTVRAGYDILIPDGEDPPTSTDRVEHPLADGPFGVVGDVMKVDSASGSLDHYFAYVERWKPGA